MKMKSRFFCVLLIIVFARSLFAQEEILAAAKQNRFDAVKKMLDSLGVEAEMIAFDDFG